MRKLVSAKYTHYLTLGDFNYPGICWENYSTSKGTDECEYHFVECVKDCYWFQHIKETTRGRGTNNASLLDLVLTNEEGMVSDINIEAPLGKSDHSVILFRFNAHITSEYEKTRYCYNKADFEAMKTELDIDWNKVLLEKSVEEQWSIFKNLLSEAVDKNTPKRIVKNSITSSRKKTFYIDTKLKSAMKKKERLWHKYKLSGEKIDQLEYNRTRNKVRNLTRKAVKNHEKKIVGDIKENPKKFWSYVKSKTKTKTSIPDLYTSDAKSDVSRNDCEKAEILADFFTSVFTEDNSEELPHIEVKNVTNSDYANLTSINKEQVQKKLEKLRIDRSPGPDSLGPKVLHELSHTLSLPLSIIFSNSIASSILPEEWKSANITALFKKGDKKYAGNYRPVSLTCILCKVLESIVRERMILHNYAEE